MKREWKLDREIMLAELWLRLPQLPSDEIARRMYTSRSAIHAKATQMQLPKRPIAAALAAAAAEALPPPPSPRDPEMPAPWQPPAFAAPTPLVVGPARTCQWPLWEHRAGREPLFCGDPVMPASRAPHSYCAHHRAMAVVHLPPRPADSPLPPPVTPLEAALAWR